MVVYSGYDVKVYFKTENNTYGDFADGGGLGSEVDAYEIPFVNSINLDYNTERANTRGLGDRTRLCKTVTKYDDSISMEITYETSEASASAWALALYADIENNNNSGYPQQFSLIVITDEDRDGAFDDEASNYFYLCKGCYIDSLTIESSEGETITLSFVISCREIVPSDGDDTLSFITYNDISSPSCTAHFNSAFAKSAGFTNDETIEEIESWAVTISNNFTKIWGSDAALPHSAIDGNVTITGSFTKSFVDVNEIDELEDETQGTLTITITTPAANSDTITLTYVNYDSVPFEVSEGDYISQDIPFTANTVTLVDDHP